VEQRISNPFDYTFIILNLQRIILNHFRVEQNFDSDFWFEGHSECEILILVSIKMILPNTSSNSVQEHSRQNLFCTLKLQMAAALLVTCQ